MSLTDIFIRRPVLAIVVNLVIIIAGLQAIRTLNVRQYPKLESATVTVRTAYVLARTRTSFEGSSRRCSSARSPRWGRDVDYIESCGASRGSPRSTSRLEAELQRGERPRRHQRARTRSAPTSPRWRFRGDQHRALRTRRSRRCTLQLRLDDPRSEPGHRLPDSRRPAAPLRPRRGAAGGHLGRPDLRDPRLAEAGSHGRPQREPVPGTAGARVEQLPGGRRPDERGARPGQPDRVHRPQVARRVQAARHSPGRGRARAALGRRRRRARLRHVRPRRSALRRKGRVHGGLGCPPQRELGRRDRAGPQRDGDRQARAPDRDGSDGRLRLHDLHRRRDPRGREDPLRDGASSSSW